MAISPSLDFGLGETASLSRDTARSFATDIVAPRADQIDRSNAFPRDQWLPMGTLGLHGSTVSEADGGADRRPAYPPGKPGEDRAPVDRLALFRRLFHPILR